jgi:hypothetical protein
VRSSGHERVSRSRRRGAALKPGQSAARRSGLGVNGGRSAVAAAGAALRQAASMLACGRGNDALLGSAQEPGKGTERTGRKSQRV